MTVRRPGRGLLSSVAHRLGRRVARSPGVDGGPAAAIAVVVVGVSWLDGAGREAGAGDDALLGAVEADAEGLVGVSYGAGRRRKGGAYPSVVVLVEQPDELACFESQLVVERGLEVERHAVNGRLGRPARSGNGGGARRRAELLARGDRVHAVLGSRGTRRDKAEVRRWRRHGEIQGARSVLPQGGLAGKTLLAGSGGAGSGSAPWHLLAGAVDGGYGFRCRGGETGGRRNRADGADGSVLGVTIVQSLRVVEGVGRVGAVARPRTVPGDGAVGGGAHGRTLPCAATSWALQLRLLRLRDGSQHETGRAARPSLGENTHGEELGHWPQTQPRGPCRCLERSMIAKGVQGSVGLFVVDRPLLIHPLPPPAENKPYTNRDDQDAGQGAKDDARL